MSDTGTRERDPLAGLGGDAPVVVERDRIVQPPRAWRAHAANRTGSVRSGSYVAAVPRLRPLSEAECYARLYGDRETAVAVIREPSEPARPSGGLLGEQLKRLFEERIDARKPEGPAEAEAA